MLLRLGRTRTCAANQLYVPLKIGGDHYGGQSTVLSSDWFTKLHSCGQVFFQVGQKSFPSNHLPLFLAHQSFHSSNAAVLFSFAM
jgi:hypothetical protein